MSDNKLDMRFKTILDIAGYLAMPWNTSFTCSSGKLAMDLNISCEDVCRGNADIPAIFPTLQVQF
jgi:hypothetical protein